MHSILASMLAAMISQGWKKAPAYAERSDRSDFPFPFL